MCGSGGGGGGGGGVVCSSVYSIPSGFVMQYVCAFYIIL